MTVLKVKLTMTVQTCLIFNKDFYIGIKSDQLFGKLCLKKYLQRVVRSIFTERCRKL